VYCVLSEKRVDHDRDKIGGGDKASVAHGKEGSSLQRIGNTRQLQQERRSGNYAKSEKVRRGRGGAFYSKRRTLGANAMNPKRGRANFRKNRYVNRVDERK